MNPTIQPGMHPDADTLTAFAEQSLPTNEREQVLAHAAVCGRCREVIFLAQQAVEEPVTSAALPSAPSVKQPVWWLARWRWAWIPAGAMAAIIATAMVLHFRRIETGTQMARNVTPPVATQAPPALTTNAQQPKPTETDAQQQSGPQPLRDRPAPRQKEEMSDRKGTTYQKERALGSAAPSIALSPGLVGGSIHGAMTARRQTTPYDGPMANQLQQNAMQQNATQQNVYPQLNALQPAPSFEQKPAAKPTASNQPPAPASETVTTDAEAAKTTPPTAASTPSTPQVNADEMVRSRSFGISPAATVQLKKSANVILPGGAQVLSTASAAGQTVALDTSGALFLSEDQGKHWHSVATQWTGRAVLVRNMQPAKDKAGSFQATPTARFELVNDKLQSWKSPDGSVWTADTPPAQK